ncbi:MAG: DoxX family protein [Chloroflexota bacterium]
MKYVLIVLQILLALAFLAAGSGKILTPADELAQQMNWVNFVPAFAVLLIGILEVAGALGLVLPWLTGIQPQLVRLAAAGLALTMLGAIITHFAVGDPIGSIIAPLILGGLAAFVAYGRTKILPLT